MNFKNDTLESVCELIVDCPHSTPKWTESGLIVLRNQNIRDGYLNLSTPSYTNKEHFLKRIKRAEPQPGDIIFTREAPMGEVCMIPKGLKCCLGQRQVLLRPKKTVNGLYLLFALQSSYVQRQIAWNEGTGSTVSNVRIPILKKLMIPRFSSQTENQIAKILYSITEKIELNRQINQTLEQMAQAIFKSWFVDFEPVKAKLEAKKSGNDPELAAMLAISGKTEADLETFANQNPEAYQQLAKTASLFPDKLVQSEQGLIPEGWDTSIIGNEFNVTMGQSPPGNTYNEEENGAPFFQGRRDFGWRYPINRVYCTAPKRFAKQGDTLLSVRAPVGDINKATTDCCIGRGLSSIRHKSGFEAYTYYLMKRLKKTFSNFDTEGTVFGSINQKDLKSIKILSPTKDLLKAFSLKAEKIDQEIYSLNEQNITLADLRDSLLPKLLSGEISVDQVKESMEKN